MIYNLYVFEERGLSNSIIFDEYTNNFISTFILYKALKMFYINKMKTNKNIKNIYIKLVKFDDCYHHIKNIRKDEIYNDFKR